MPKFLPCDLSPLCSYVFMAEKTRLSIRRARWPLVGGQAGQCSPGAKAISLVASPFQGSSSNAWIVNFNNGNSNNNDNSNTYRVRCVR